MGNSQPSVVDIKRSGDSNLGIDAAANAQRAQVVMDRVQSLISFTIGLIPGIGGIAAFALDSFWALSKKQQDIWEEIREQVSDLIDEKILAAEFAERTADIRGLQRNIQVYKDTAAAISKGSTLQAILVRCNDIYEQIIGSKNKHHLIHLFINLAHIHVGLLREYFDTGDAYDCGIDTSGTCSGSYDKNRGARLCKTWMEQYRDVFPGLLRDYESWRASCISTTDAKDYGLQPGRYQMISVQDSKSGKKRYWQYELDVGDSADRDNMGPSAAMKAGEDICYRERAETVAAWKAEAQASLRSEDLKKQVDLLRVYAEPALLLLKLTG